MSYFPLSFTLMHYPDFNLVLPLMVGSITAYLTGELISPGSLYDRLLDWRGIRTEEETPSSWLLAGLSAGDIMEKQVEVIDISMDLSEIVTTFCRSSHQGFPVVDQGQVVGIITQRDLSDLAQRLQSLKDPDEGSIKEIIDSPPITASPGTSLVQLLSLLDQHQLSRLPIVQDQKLVGIVTRSDIIRVEVERLAEKGALA